MKKETAIKIAIAAALVVLSYFWGYHFLDGTSGHGRDSAGLGALIYFVPTGIAASIVGMVIGTIWPSGRLIGISATVALMTIAYAIGLIVNA